MEFQIRTPELARALARVQGVVEKKTTMPILANVLIKSNGKDAVSIAATDLEIGLTAEYEAKVTKPGAMTLGAKALFDIVRALPEATVSLKLQTNQWVEITCGKVKYRVVGIDPAHFPTLPRFADVAFFPVDPKVVRLMIDMALPSVCTDDTRSNLLGAYVEPMATSPGLRMVSTDGHRLAVIDRPLATAPVMRGPVIVPRKGLGEMKKVLDNVPEGAEVRLGFVENSAVLEVGGVTLSMRLLDAKFPEYQAVIPQSASRYAKVSRGELASALKRVSLLASDKSVGVRLSLEAGTLALYMNNPDAGEASEEIAIDYTGDPLKIGVNARYLLDALGACGAETPTLEMTDELSPLVVRPDDTASFVIMPLRI